MWQKSAFDRSSALHWAAPTQAGMGWNAAFKTKKTKKNKKPSTKYSKLQLLFTEQVEKQSRRSTISPPTIWSERNGGETVCVYRSCPAETVALHTVRWGYFCSCAFFFFYACAVTSAWMTLVCHICVEKDDVAIFPGIFFAGFMTARTLIAIQ